MNRKNVKLGRAIACVILVLSLWGCVKMGGVDGSNAKVDWENIRKQKQAAEMIEQKLIDANPIFGFKLFQEIIQTEGDRQNIFVSPTS